MKRYRERRSKVVLKVKKGCEVLGIRYWLPEGRVWVENSGNSGGGPPGNFPQQGLMSQPGSFTNLAALATVSAGRSVEKEREELDRGEYGVGPAFPDTWGPALPTVPKEPPQ